MQAGRMSFLNAVDHGHNLRSCKINPAHLGIEGGVRVCGDAVLRYFWCGFAVIFILTCGIAVSKH